MSRKDYIAIAAILFELKDQIPEETWYQLVGDIANWLAADNELFDRDRFIDAATP